MIWIVYLLTLLLSLAYWRSRPADLTPIFFSLAMLFWVMASPDRSGYDRSMASITNSVLILVHTFRNYGRQR